MAQPRERSYKYLDLITALFVAVLLTSNVASSKILELGLFTFDGGTLLFPLSYIFGDILTEVYGYRRSRRVIWVGFGCAALMAGVLALVGALPPAEGWWNQEAYEAMYRRRSLTSLSRTARALGFELISRETGEMLG